MNRAFHCYVCPCDGRWHAICVDFDVAVDGDSPREAEESLATAVDMHLEALSEYPADERGRFLARRTPWPVRLRLAAEAWLGAVRGGEKAARRFALTPAMPGFMEKTGARAGRTPARSPPACLS